MSERLHLYAILKTNTDLDNNLVYPYTQLELDLNRIVGEDRWQFLTRGFWYAVVVFLAAEDLVKCKMFMHDIMECDGSGYLDDIKKIVEGYY